MHEVHMSSWLSRITVQKLQVSDLKQARLKLHLRSIELIASECVPVRLASTYVLEYSKLSIPWQPYPELFPTKLGLLTSHNRNSLA